jgi:hypothetical protein
VDQQTDDFMLSREVSEAAILMLKQLHPLSSVLPVEPGHVMSRKKFAEMLEQQK